MYFLKLRKKTADSLVEYALILGIVSLALIGMNTYIKRGVQGRIKDMADNFISREQVVEADPTTVSKSETTTLTPENTITRELLGGGAIRTAIVDNTKINIIRDTATQADPLSRGQKAVKPRGVAVPEYGSAPYTPSYTPGVTVPPYVYDQYYYPPASSGSGDQK